MAESNQKIALFIDADNAPARKIEKILSEMAKYGVVSIRRAYGNWKSHTIKGWEEQLHEYAIQPVQQFDLTKGKNATDMAMTIDAMDTLYTKNMDAFCIVSSDSDFTPLIMRLLSEGNTN
ncbi:NYN domain-containing protein [Endozoicomonas atrinae]|uniref:NYN domain-containing protein n=1 Tax=Endozoicomonas atrinae TaxID=1333660 RepID=UPI000B2BA926|nr:NYN domain-containing protein [Endozoicomonas atrinae]